MRTLPLALVALLLSGGVAGADRPDAWITAKVKTRLLTKGGVSGIDVNVDTNDRVVTLHGVVGSEAERQRAVDQAQRTEGVLSVQDYLVVAPKEGGAKRHVMATRDDRLQREVEMALGAGGKPLQKVRVKSVNGGTVLLTGETASQHDHLEAISVAGGVPGVREVGSTIEAPDDTEPSIFANMTEEIDWDASAEPRDFSRTSADAWITTKTKTRLLVDPDLPGTGINVDTRRGYVTLFGTVDDRATSALAEREALQVDGVRGVRNELQVVRPDRQAVTAQRDSEAERAVKERLKEREDLDGVSVSVKGGVARLTGTVGSHHRELHALYLVRTTEGVDSVVNDLLVRRPQG